MKASVAFLALAATLASAQNFFSSSDVPACALNCQTLNNAQQGCLPNVSPQPAVCFCQSSLLTNLIAQPAAVCSGCTAASDQSQLAGWYNYFCNGGGRLTYQASGAATSAPTAAATSPATAASTTAASNGAASTVGASPSSGTTSSDSGDNSGDSSSDGNLTTNNANRTWWDLHKGWIAMVIVLIIGFGIIIWVAIWWKKRYIRKRDAAGAILPGAWGPSQNQHPASFPAAGAEKSHRSVARSASQGSPRASTKEKISRTFRR